MLVGVSSVAFVAARLGNAPTVAVTAAATAVGLLVAVYC